MTLKLPECESEPCEDLKKDCSREVEQQVQRHWGGNEFGMFEELQKNQCAWCSISNGRVVDNETR